MNDSMPACQNTVARGTASARCGRSALWRVAKDPAKWTTARPASPWLRGWHFCAFAPGTILPRDVVDFGVEKSTAAALWPDPPEQIRTPLIS